MADSPDMTRRGTPYSKKWDAAWREKLDALENKLDRPCCGAHAPDGMPCELGSSHKNGRCRFHGGVDDIGAPVGNSNARIHGLYARRLQQCGDHCPMWETCPLAGPDVMKVAAQKRPICAYEKEEFEVLYQLDQKSKPNDRILDGYYRDLDPHPHQSHVVSLQENLSIMQIMITRAANAVRAVGATQDLRVTSDNYNLTTHKTSAALQAFQILTREYRCTLNTLHRIVDRLNLPRTYHEPKPRDTEERTPPPPPNAKAQRVEGAKNRKDKQSNDVIPRRSVAETVEPRDSTHTKRLVPDELPEPFRTLAKQHRAKQKPT